MSRREAPGLDPLALVRGCRVCRVCRHVPRPRPPCPHGAGPLEVRSVEGGRVLAPREVRLVVLRGMHRAGLRIPLRIVAELSAAPDAARGA